jgi:hypothetical protein
MLITPTSATSIASSALFIGPRRTTTLTLISLDEIDRKIDETMAFGGTQILLQGGHHPSSPNNGTWTFLLPHEAEIPRGQHYGV